MSHPQTAQPAFAAMLVIIAMTIMGLIDNIVVVVAETAGIWQFHFCRAILALIIVGGFIHLTGGRIRPQNFKPVILRSALISLSMMLYFGALAFLTVPEAAAGLFASPIIVVLISGLLLGHRISGMNILAVIGGFCGVLMVLQPDLTDLSPIKLMPVAAAFFYAIAAIITRRTCGGESALTLIFWFFVALLLWGALGMVVLAVTQPEVLPGTQGFLTRGWVPMTQEFILWTSVQAVGSAIAVGLLTRAYLLAEAHFVAAYEYAILIMGAFWGWLIWGQTLDTLSIIGMVMIITFGTLLAQSERRAVARIDAA